ncbi:MAG: mannose-1-phosphate guanyltransferase [Armatimonadetes bacterium]|nr:mannose-1-phosphate guanyltransferase [Armatimonadota bacterium]
MKAVVMGGGQGSRLRPLTCNRPKPLVPVCNKPVMEYAMELLKRHGVETVLVTLHYLADEVTAHFGYGTDWGLRILYHIEDEPLGTAGSVKNVEDQLTDTFLVISGDALTDFDLSAALRFHKEKEAAATVVLTRVENPLEFGMVITDEQQRIVRFLEKPTWGEVFSDTINTGLYILEPRILELMECGKAYDFSKDLFPALLQKGYPLFGYIAEGYWCDIGNLEQYHQAHLDMLSGRVNHKIPGEPLADQIWVGRGTRIHPGAHLRGPAVIGRNCRIHENARILDFTVIGDNCIVEEGASLHRDVVWNNVFVGRNVRSAGAAICRHVTLKANVSVGTGAVIGDDVFVGEGAILQPEVKVWPDKNIEAGANVSLSLVWGRKWPGSLFGENGLIGLGNIEITPDFAMKLGAAYGASLEKGAVIVGSRDSHAASRMTNRALVCGLVSVGVDVRDLRVIPNPISRMVLKNTNAVGGLHCRVARHDARSLQIQFFDSRGVNIEKSVERKIENNFFREDFRRTSMEEVGHIEFPSRTVEQYVEDFANHPELAHVRRAGFKVVIDYAYGNASVALPAVLGKLGCETISVNAFLDPLRARELYQARDRSLRQLADIVTTLHADLGVMLDVDAERMAVVDDQGRILEGPELLALMAMLVFRQNRPALVAAPVNGPSVLDQLAQELEGRVIWTSTDPRSLMHTATLGAERIVFAGYPTGELIFPAFSPGFDAMFAFARLLAMMASEKAPLSEMIGWIPPFAMAHQTLPCSFAQKGRVMRMLIEDSRDQQTEMIDGIKIFEEGGWTLVVPDRTRPILGIWAEGLDRDQAERLIDTQRQRLLALLDRPSLASEEAPPRPRLKPSMTVPLPEDRAFHFWTPGRYLGVRARTWQEFLDTLHYIEPASLSYHLERGDFGNWVEYELNELELADRIRQLRTRGTKGEDLRASLLRIFRGSDAASGTAPEETGAAAEPKLEPPAASAASLTSEPLEES